MYHVDILGQHISVGDRVLTKGFHSSSIDSIATVIRLNSKSITLSVEEPFFNYGDLARYDRHVTKSTKLRKLRRYPNDILVLNDLIPILKRNALSALHNISIPTSKLKESEFNALSNRLKYHIPWNFFNSPILNLTLDEILVYTEKAIKDLEYQHPEYSI